MPINMDPRFSPVWCWLRDHAAAGLLVVFTSPQLPAALAGDPHAILDVALGTLVAVGILGKRYATPA